MCVTRTYSLDSPNTILSGASTAAIQADRSPVSVDTHTIRDAHDSRGSLGVVSQRGRVLHVTGASTVTALTTTRADEGRNNHVSCRASCNAAISIFSEFASLEIIVFVVLLGPTLPTAYRTPLGAVGFCAFALECSRARRLRVKAAARLNFFEAAVEMQEIVSRGI